MGIFLKEKKKKEKEKGLSGQNLKYKDFYWNNFKKPTALVALFDPKSQTTNFTNLHPLGKITPLLVGPNLYNVSDDKHLSIEVYRVLLLRGREEGHMSGSRFWGSKRCHVMLSITKCIFKFIWQLTFIPFTGTIGFPFPSSILDHPVISYEVSFYLGMGRDIIATTQHHCCVDKSRAAAFILTFIIFSFLIATDDSVVYRIEILS